MATSAEEASGSAPEVTATESAASSKEDPPSVVDTGTDGFDQFYSEVKEIEKRDSTLTSATQLDRLTRPGATYFNLNPYDVLQVDHDASLSEIKQKYRRMSILVHPDKNQNDLQRAEKAFEAVNKSWKTLENEEGYRRCQEIIEEAKTRTDTLVKQKKKQLKKEGKSTDIPEDNEKQYKHAVYVQTCKLFADLERYRREKEAKEMHERKRKAEEEIQEEENKKKQNEWKKNYEESRTGRVNSWRDWKKGSKKKSGSLKPPKLKAEKR